MPKRPAHEPHVGCVGLIQAVGHEVQKLRRVSLLLLQMRVRGIGLAERAVTGQYVALEVKAASRRGQRAEAMVPASAVHVGILRVDPQLPRRIELGGVVAEFVVGAEPQLRP